MSAQDPQNTADKADSKRDPESDNTSPEAADRPRELGGRGGLDPTRYGDWEKAGRCIDF
ncbi:MAG: DUF1674 domain-containing protein [Woeseiaceae bacterium]